MLTNIIVQSIGASLLGIGLMTSAHITDEAKYSWDNLNQDVTITQEISLSPGQSHQISHHQQLTTTESFTFASKTNKKPIPQHPASPKPIPASSYDQWFEEYGHQFGVDPKTLKSIAHCESHQNPAAISRNGTYAGMFQYSESTWRSTRVAMGADPNPELRHDAQQSILTTAFKIASGGIRAWPHCGRHFH